MNQMRLLNKGNANKQLNQLELLHFKIGLDFFKLIMSVLQVNRIQWEIPAAFFVVCLVLVLERIQKTAHNKCQTNALT